MKPHPQFISSPPALYLIAVPLQIIAPLPSDSSHSFYCSTLFGHSTPPFPYFILKSEVKNQSFVGSNNLEKQPQRFPWNWKLKFHADLKPKSCG